MQPLRLPSNLSLFFSVCRVRYLTSANISEESGKTDCQSWLWKIPFIPEGACISRPSTPLATKRELTKTNSILICSFTVCFLYFPDLPWLCFKVYLWLWYPLRSTIKILFSFCWKTNDCETLNDFLWCQLLLRSQKDISS